MARARSTKKKKGAELAAFWRELLALAVFASAMLALASLRLRREWA